MSRAVLYDYYRSSAAYRVRIALNLKGVDYESRPVNLLHSEQKADDYRALNPQGLVPMLEIDGHRLTQSLSIIVYLDQTISDPPLMPKSPAERTRMRLWSKFVDEGLFDGVTELSFSAMFRERMKNMSPELREKRFKNVGDPRRTDRFKSTYEHGVYSPFVNAVISGRLPKGKDGRGPSKPAPRRRRLAAAGASHAA